MIPTTFKFTIAPLTGAATQVKGTLYRFQPSRTGQSPDWTRQDGQFPEEYPAVPITDRSFWEGRYALCTLTLEREDGERLEMNDAVVTLQRERNIVSTPMVGMDGTVKEYINEGDYDIKIAVGIQAVRDGRIVDEYPSDGIRELRKFLDEKASLNVFYSEFLGIFDITKMVIKKVSLTQNTASNYQTLTIEAWSDEDYNVYSTEY